MKFHFVCHKKHSFCTFLPIYHSLKRTSSTTSDHSFPPLWTKKRRGNDLGIYPPTDLLSPNYQRRRSLFRHRRSRVLIWRPTRRRIFPRRWSASGRLAPRCDAGVRRAPCRPCVPPAGSRRDCRLRATIRSGTVQHVRSPTADCCYAVRCVKVHEMCRKVISTHKPCPYVFTLVLFDMSKQHPVFGQTKVLNSFPTARDTDVDNHLLRKVVLLTFKLVGFLHLV